METLICTAPALKELDLTNNTELKELHVHAPLAQLGLSQNTELKGLEISDSALTTLDLSQNTELKGLDISGSALTTLDLSQNTKLERLDISGSALTALDLSQNTELKSLDISGSALTALDLSQNTMLESLDISGSALATLDLSQNTALEACTAEKLGQQHIRADMQWMDDHLEVDLAKIVGESNLIRVLSVYNANSGKTYEFANGIIWIDKSDLTELGEDQKYPELIYRYSTNNKAVPEMEVKVECVSEPAPGEGPAVWPTDPAEILKDFRLGASCTVVDGEPVISGDSDILDIRVGQTVHIAYSLLDGDDGVGWETWNFNDPCVMLKKLEEHYGPFSFVCEARSDPDTKFVMAPFEQEGEMEYVYRQQTSGAVIAEQNYKITFPSAAYATLGIKFDDRDPFTMPGGAAIYGIAEKKVNGISYYYYLSYWTSDIGPEPDDTIYAIVGETAGKLEGTEFTPPMFWDLAYDGVAADAVLMWAPADVDLSTLETLNLPDGTEWAYETDLLARCPNLKTINLGPQSCPRKNSNS